MDKTKRLAETENEIRNKLRQKNEQHHFQSSVTLYNVAKNVNNSDYNRELLKGRYSMSIKDDSSNEVLKKIAHEEVAF